MLIFEAAGLSEGQAAPVPTPRPPLHPSQPSAPECNPEFLFRLLRGAVQIGILAADRASPASPTTTTFRATALSAVLREDHPNSLRYLLLLQVDQGRAYDSLAWAVRTGGYAYKKVGGRGQGWAGGGRRGPGGWRPAAARPWAAPAPPPPIRHPSCPPPRATHAQSYGVGLYDRLRSDPAMEARFSRAMKFSEVVGGPSVVADYPWGGHGRIVDVGAAYGSFLASVLDAHPSLAGVLFDQPQVVAAARAGDWSEEGGAYAHLNSRTQLVAGDMFDAATLPRLTSADAVVYRLILHNWGDADVVRTLTAVREAAGAEAPTLCIVEQTPPDTIADPVYRRAFMDLQMMISCDSTERTPMQWGALLAKAGWGLVRVVPTRGPYCVTVARPAAA